VQPQDIHAKEADFHDRWADDTELDNIRVRDAFEAITALENRFILTLMKDLRGKKLLDVGSGLGESSIYFALQGAQVTALDISPHMIELAKRNAERHGVSIEGVVACGETLDFPANSFDIVHVANCIHHLHDREQFLRNVQTVLRPGGLFVAWDPLRYNPVINVYRRMATKVRTEDETPLGFDDLELSRRFFPNLQHREFWLLTLTLFLKYYLINRYDVNEIRYWKRILLETPKTIGWWFTPLAAIDRILLRLPLVRRLAWNTVQWGNKPSEPSATPPRA
jgi:SAM-dependent methyltransferase